MLVYSKALNIRSREPYTTYEIRGIHTLDTFYGLKTIYLVYVEDDKSYYFNVNKWYSYLQDTSMVADMFMPERYMLTDKPPSPKIATYVNGRFYNKKMVLGDIPDGHGGHNRDLIITREEYDIRTFHDRILTTVGGLIHNTDTDGVNLYVLGGGKSIQRDKRDIGFISIPSKSKLIRKNLTSDMIYSDGDYSSYLTLTLDTPPGIGWVPVFIIAGYLEVLGNTVTRISGNKYKIELVKSYFLERMIEHGELVTGESIATDVDGVYDIEKIRSEEFIRKIFDSLLTFVIMVRADSVASKPIQINSATLPGKYKFTCMPDLPMVSGFGGIVEYVSHKYEGFITTETDDTRLKRFLVDPKGCTHHNGAINPMDKLYRKTAFTMIIVDK